MSELIAFFSRRDENYVNGEIKTLEIGNTEIAAGMIKKLTGADSIQLIPEQPYSKDYNECTAEAKEDQRRNARPALKTCPSSIAEYDTIYLGYPNYWGTMPMAVVTFLEKFDFSGKTIRPFCTHEGSGLGSSIQDIKKCCPNAIVTEGLALHGGSIKRAEKEIEQWI
ncbi:MAG: flavodoxin [bacterium]|nr:flavodoxin [bacterium]